MNGHGWLLLCLGLFMPVLLTIEILIIRNQLQSGMTDHQFTFRRKWGMNTQRQHRFIILLGVGYMLLLAMFRVLDDAAVVVWCSLALCQPLFAFREQMFNQAQQRRSSH